DTDKAATRTTVSVMTTDSALCFISRRRACLARSAVSGILSSILTPPAYSVGLQPCQRIHALWAVCRYAQPRHSPVHGCHHKPAYCDPVRGDGQYCADLACWISLLYALLFSRIQLILQPVFAGLRLQ